MSFLGTAARASPPATSGRGASPAALQARAPAARALLAHPRRAQRAVRTASVRVRAERATRTASGGVKVYEQEVTSSKLKVSLSARRPPGGGGGAAAAGTGPLF